MSERSRQILIPALDGIAILAYVATFAFTVMCIAGLLNNVFVDGLSWGDAVVELAMNDMGSAWWVFVSIPIWLTARGLHGLLEYGRFTFRSWPKV